MLDVEHGGGGEETAVKVGLSYRRRAGRLMIATHESLFGKYLNRKIVRLVDSFFDPFT